MTGTIGFDVRTQDGIIAGALTVLRGGGTILYPTDTVWGIGCDATNPAAVEKVYAIKQRSDSKALVLLAGDLDMVARYVREIPEMAITLVEVNDAPMTIIYPGAYAGTKPEEGIGAVADRHRLAYNVVAEDGSVGIRIPLMDFCRNMVCKLGRPIVSTSANISGGKTPGHYSEIPDEIIKAVDYVVPQEFEKGSTGKPSQIIKFGPRGEIEIIRE